MDTRGACCVASPERRVLHSQHQLLLPPDPPLPPRLTGKGASPLTHPSHLPHPSPLTPPTPHPSPLTSPSHTPHPTPLPLTHLTPHPSLLPLAPTPPHPSLSHPSPLTPPSHTLYPSPPSRQSHSPPRGGGPCGAGEHDEPGHKTNAQRTPHHTPQ